MAKKNGRFRWLQPGWRSALRIALVFSLLFSAVGAGVYFSSLYFLAKKLHENQLRDVQRQALEYRSWFGTGRLDVLEERMSEERLLADDVVFVHVRGPRLDYVKFNVGREQRVPADQAHQLDPLEQGIAVQLGGEPWTVSSVPVLQSDMVLQVGKNHRTLEATLASFRKRFLWILGPGMVVTALAGAIGVFRTLLPIRRLIDTTQRILAGAGPAERVETEKQTDELTNLAALFNQLLDQNEVLVRGMQESLDHLAHDFRTPLNRIHLAAERALANSNDPKGLVKALEDCGEESDYLTRLLNTLMDVAQAEAGGLVLQKEVTAATELFREVVDLYEFVAEDAGVELVAEPNNINLVIDRTWMSRVLANLVDNAIKHGGDNGKVTLRVFRKNEKVVIEVADTGPGIAEEDLPHVFERLYRADQSRHTRGMGLGLNLVDGVVKAHGGEVTIRNEGGTVVTITLPRGE